MHAPKLKHSYTVDEYLEREAQRRSGANISTAKSTRWRGKASVMGVLARTLVAFSLPNYAASRANHYRRIPKCAAARHHFRASQRSACFPILIL